MTIYLMRHGETDWNKQNRIQGRQNIGLNVRGSKQARVASKRLFEDLIFIDRIVSSPLQRAAQTALMIAEERGLPVQFDARFAERGFGELEGLRLDEIVIKFKIVDPEDIYSSSHGIESVTDMDQRIWQGIRAISEQETENVLIVTHGSIIRLLTGIHEIVSNGLILPFRVLVQSSKIHDNMIKMKS